MTEQSNAKTSQRAYNYDVEQLTTAERTTLSNGTKQVKFRAKLTIRGEIKERTVIAQGKAVDLLTGKLRKGNKFGLRVVFNRAPANDNGRGGEYLSVVDLPRAKAA